MKLKTTFLAATASLGMAVASHAVIIITPASTIFDSGDETSQAAINAIVLPAIAPSTELYKSNVEGGEEGLPLDGSYSTVFSNTEEDPEDATITYDGGPIVGPTAYLLVKDGNAEPAWYLFDLTNDFGWDGMETLQLEDFWADSKGAISHVSLYGGDGERVPDGGATVTLLGLTLLGVTFGRRFKRA